MAHAMGMSAMAGAVEKMHGHYRNSDGTIDGMKAAITSLLVDYAAKHGCSISASIKADGEDQIDLAVEFYPEGV